jgi:hypothetical protein
LPLPPQMMRKPQKVEEAEEEAMKPQEQQVEGTE